jgi:hypothetical protein
MVEMTVDDMPPAAVTVESTDLGKRVSVRLSRDQLDALATASVLHLDDIDDPARGKGNPPLDVVSVMITVA